MEHELKDTWERYVSSWKAETPKQRRDIFASSLDEGCVYRDPLKTARGWDELSDYMTDFHRQIPGGHFVTTQFFAHSGRSVARWNMVDGNGTVLGDGISYGEYDDARRLVAMTGFFDPPPA